MSFASALNTAMGAVIRILGEDAAATYTTSGGVVVPDVRGMFDAAYVLAEAGGHAGVTTTTPALFIRLADLPVDPAADTRGARVQVNGGAFKVKDVRKDGRGWAVLLLGAV